MGSLSCSTAALPCLGYALVPGQGEGLGPIGRSNQSKLQLPEGCWGAPSLRQGLGPKAQLAADERKSAAAAAAQTGCRDQF